MPIFKIPVIWQMAGTIVVEAESLEEAEEKALNEEGLPSDGEYISDSIELDFDNIAYGQTAYTNKS